MNIAHFLGKSTARFVKRRHVNLGIVPVDRELAEICESAASRFGLLEGATSSDGPRSQRSTCKHARSGNSMEYENSVTGPEGRARHVFGTGQLN